MKIHRYENKRCETKIDRTTMDAKLIIQMRQDEEHRVFRATLSIQR